MLWKFRKIQGCRSVPLCLVCLRWLSYERVKCTEKVKRNRKNGSILGCLERKKAGTPLTLVKRGMQTVRNDCGFFSISDSSLLRAKRRALGGNSEDCSLSVTESTRGTVPFCCVCMYGGFGNAELRGGGADGRPVFDDVYGQITGPFFDICIQIHHSPFSRSQCI